MLFRVEVLEPVAGGWHPIGFRPTYDEARAAADTHFEHRHKRIALTFRITEWQPVSDTAEFTLRRPI